MQDSGGDVMEDGQAGSAGVIGGVAGAGPFDNWTVQMRKGILDFCILGALRHGEKYGYALVKELVAVPGIGVSEGSIYPLLSRLKRQGLVETRLEESSGGPARKYYRLSGAGLCLAEEMAEYFLKMAKGVAGLTAAPGGADNTDSETR